MHYGIKIEMKTIPWEETNQKPTNSLKPAQRNAVSVFFLSLCVRTYVQEVEDGFIHVFSC